MTDVNVNQFIKKGLRGGTSYNVNRYGKANNEYMEDYNENEPSKYNMYLDPNNLYGCAKSQYLSAGGFKWLSQKKIDKLNLRVYTEENIDV
ncbi:hypothetical protein AWC38_SpisGene15850 [Stylophora pistillata]|uniref:Uncharacterized protein n=1 Tax=Stylophora pistillata TaxID=50429 RepID=A0A2B4RSB8_STYPI|nr:hypothetical protein AWC38_SpisGene15850 [Stylophora pistillata]